jgi:DNA-binding NtrC family response regulator
LVDDEHNALVALSKILREDGYDVFVASTEEQAMNRLKRWKFDFIITDLFLLHGYCVNLLNKIKGLKPHTPVILTTAHGNVERFLDELSIEGMICLSKPIKYDELKRTIEIVEARNEQRRKLENSVGNSTGIRSTGI